MLLSSRLPLSDLTELCRSLRHYLGAGLSLVEVFAQQARKGPSAVRPLAERIVHALERGSTLEDVLKRESAFFPPLFLALSSVGEQTGMMPEVFAELEKYYRRQMELRRQFIGQITWPVMQFILSVFVVAGLIFILGMLPPMQGRDGQMRPYDPLGWGLTGGSGALIFLGIVFGSLLALAGVYVALTRSLRYRERVDAYLLRLPVLAPCLRALALTRFCLALRLTFETGMPTVRAVRLGMRATGNSAFAQRSAQVETSIRQGNELTESLARTGLFPEEFEKVLEVGEESGRLTDVLRHQADHYHEEAGRRLTALTSAAGYGVWVFIGVFIIVVIFRLFGSYLQLLDSFM